MMNPLNFVNFSGLVGTGFAPSHPPVRARTFMQWRGGRSTRQGPQAWRPGPLLTCLLPSKRSNLAYWYRFGSRLMFSCSTDWRAMSASMSALGAAVKYAQK